MATVWKHECEAGHTWFTTILGVLRVSFYEPRAADGTLMVSSQKEVCPYCLVKFMDEHFGAKSSVLLKGEGDA